MSHLPTLSRRLDQPTILPITEVDWTIINSTFAPSSSLFSQNAVVNLLEATTWSAEVLARVVTIVVIMVLTLVGNVALVGGICCYDDLRRKRVSVFLVNLAAADLMVCAVTMTTEIFFVAFGEWILGAVGCKLVVYAQIVTLASTTFLLTAMSIDRYQVLVQPLRSLRGQPTVRRKVQVAWLLAFLFATPQLFIFVETEETLNGRTARACISRGYTAQWQRKVYFSFLSVYILVIPAAIMFYCYLNIIRSVWTRSRGGGGGGDGADKGRVVLVGAQTVFHNRRSGSAETTTTTLASSTRDGSRNSMVCFGLPRQMVASSKRNVIKMTLSVILGFLICWTPYFVVSLIRIFSDYRFRLENLLSVCEIMAMAHSAMNPILYGFFSTRTMRLATGQLIHRFGRRRIHNVSCDDTIYLSEYNNRTPTRLWQRGRSFDLRNSTNAAAVGTADPRRSVVVELKRQNDSLTKALRSQENNIQNRTRRSVAETEIRSSDLPLMRSPSGQFELYYAAQSASTSEGRFLIRCSYNQNNKGYGSTTRFRVGHILEMFKNRPAPLLGKIPDSSFGGTPFPSSCRHSIPAEVGRRRDFDPTDSRRRRSAAEFETLRKRNYSHAADGSTGSTEAPQLETPLFFRPSRSLPDGSIQRNCNRRFLCRRISSAD